MKPSLRPFRSLSEFTGDLGIATQTNSATVCTLPLMIFRSAPPWTAETTAETAASPYDSLPPSRLRIVVPPPSEVRMPSTSTFSSLKYPFSIATAKGMPFVVTA